MTYTNDLVKINGDFSATQKAIDYVINPVWQNKESLWAFVSASQEGIGQIVYEHIANLVQNVRDIDTCGVHQLYSMSKELDVDQIFSYDLNYPVDLEELINTLSTSRSFTVVSGYILNTLTLDDIYQTIGTDITNVQYYDISGEITLPEYSSSTGTIYSLPWTDVKPSYYDTNVNSGVIIDMVNTSDFTSGTITKITIDENVYFGQCVYIDDNMFIELSGTIMPSGNITNLAYSDNVINIQDPTYITGFIEPLIKNHLIEYANYNEVNFVPWTENQIDSFYQEFSGVIDRRELDFLAQEGTLSSRKLIAKQYQGFMDDIYYDPASEYKSNSGEIIEYCTHVLRNVCIRASYQRETLKTIAQKHAMIGSTRAIEKLISEYILRSFTKKDGWRLYVEPSGTTQQIQNAYQMETYLPPLSSVYGQFDTKVVEYWDITEYLNISAESPLVCGITGYTNTSDITSVIDISGNLITGIVTGWTPSYGQGLCGYVVTGGNYRYWEGENLYDAILMSETNSAEVSAFYSRMGMSGTFDELYASQTYLWDMHAVSGLNRMATIPDLTGTPLEEYSATPPSAIPASGWLVVPTSLSNIHKKYIGTLTGEVPPNNIKNQLYPTMAPQPFIWNLVEKLIEEFPKILQTLLFTDQSTIEQLSAQVDISGNLIDSWKYFNQEYIGYNTQYEESKNLDFIDQMNNDIDRDGPFHVDTLSAYVDIINNGITPINTAMSGFYDQIERHFSLTNSNSPNITNQLNMFSSDILNLTNKHIYNYAYDHLDNHFMLYKNDDEFETPGQLWMRYRNHPLPFPMSQGTTEVDRKTQQVYMHDGDDIYGRNYESIYNSKCYDFGIFGSMMWIFGEDTVDTTKLSGQVDKNKILIFELSDVFNPYEPANDEFHYSMVFNSLRIHSPSSDEEDLDGYHYYGFTKKNFIGVYTYERYIVIVYLEKRKLDTGAMTFIFKHYDRYINDFITHPREIVTIEDGVYNNRTKKRNPLPEPYTNLRGDEHIWKLSVSEELVTIGYESFNSAFALGETDFENSITTIDLYKDTLNDNDYFAYEWKYIVENM